MAVVPKGWRVDEFRRGVFHPYRGPKRFVSVREGTLIIRVTDGEERTFKKGDIFEAVDLLSIPQTQNRVARTCEFGDIECDGRPPQVALVPRDRAVPVPRGVAGRNSRSSPSGECASAQVAEAPCLQQHRSARFRWPSMA